MLIVRLSPSGMACEPQVVVPSMHANCRFPKLAYVVGKSIGSTPTEESVGRYVSEMIPPILIWPVPQPDTEAEFTQLKTEPAVVSYWIVSAYTTPAPSSAKHGIKLD